MFEEAKAWLLLNHPNDFIKVDECVMTNQEEITLYLAGICAWVYNSGSSYHSATMDELFDNVIWVKPQ